MRGTGRARVAALLLGVVASVAAAGSTVVMTSPGAHAADVVAPPLRTSATLETLQGTSGTVSIPVPAGIVPTYLTATLTSDRPAGRVEVLLGGMTAYTSTGKARETIRVRVPAGALDAQRRLPVALRYTLPPDPTSCVRPPDVHAGLAGIALQYAGSEVRPTQVADFFPALSPQVVVQVAPDADDAVLDAALVAVASLGWRYRSETDVALASTAAPLPLMAPGSRVVRLEQGDGPAKAAIGAGAVPTLVLTGGSDELVAAARALRDPALRLAGAAEVEDLGQAEEQTDPETLERRLRQTLEAAAGSDPLTLSGWGTTQAYLGLSQDSFGGPVSEVKLHIVGTHTALPDGAHAQLDLLVNDRLVDSVALDHQGDQRDPDVGIDLSAVVSATDLASDNGVVLRLSSDPGGEHCATPSDGLPFQVDIDTAESVATATRGPGRLAGFALFPQVLGGDLPVGIRGEGGVRLTRAAQAAVLVAELQRRASRPLDVHLVDADAFVAGSASGLLVGATAQDASELKAPLRLDRLRKFDYVDSAYQVAADAPFAALQAFDSGERTVLLLGGWSPDGTSPDTLAASALSKLAADGWGSLTDDVLVATAGQPAFTLATTAFVPQRQVQEEAQGYFRWFVVGLVVLAVLVGINWLVMVRRKRRIRELVEAQERADAERAAVEHADADRA